MYNRVTWRTYQGHGVGSRGQRLDLDKFFPSPNGKETSLDESIVDKSVGRFLICRYVDVDGVMSMVAHFTSHPQTFAHVRPASAGNPGASRSKA